jgi:Asp-tRNA(Asn)/Glu-tRNA(Gln) amidotransferase A subunit family amidase
MSYSLSFRVESLADAVRAGRIGPRDIVAECLNRIAARDPTLHSFALVDADGATQAAENLQQEADFGRVRGPLHGIPVAVKDIIDVAGLPTRAGSGTRNCCPPADADATMVARLRTAGAVIVGKSVTTEYAWLDPGPTVNPWNSGHTPGGSSSGSAAAVAAGLVPLALGTQTGGSVCRPAVYCGTAAIKPTYGLLPTDGVIPLAPSLDTLGCFAHTVTGAALGLAALAGDPALAGQAEWDEGCRLHIAVLCPRFYMDSEPVVAEFHAGTIRRLTKAGVKVAEIDLPFDLEPVLADCRTVIAGEAYRCHQDLFETQGDRLQPKLRGILANGKALSSNAVADALGQLEDTRACVWAAAEPFDALLLQPVPGPAPRGLETTGSLRYLAPWTAFYGPLVVIPGTFAPGHLPLAAMLAAAPGQDERLVNVARTVEPLIDIRDSEFSA